MLYSRFALLSTLLGMASAVDYSGKPSLNSHIDSIRRRAKSGKGGKSGGGDEWHSSGSDDWHHSEDVDYTGRFSGSAKATLDQVVLQYDFTDDVSPDTKLVLDTMSTADIHWKFDEGFTEMIYKISISPAKSGTLLVDTVLACASAGSEEPYEEYPIVLFTDREIVHVDANDNVVLSQGKLDMDNVDVNETDCDDDLPCMYVQECDGVMINNMASLYQAIKNGYVFMLADWIEGVDNTPQEEIDAGVVRGQMFV